MAQFSTLLPVLLLVLAVFNPIVCPSSKIYTERRDRAPYIESREHSPQNLADAGSLGLSPSRKAQIPAPPPTLRSFEDINTKIESVFDTKFGPGLHLFKNTAPTHFNSFDSEYMHADQPQAHQSSTSVASSPTPSPSSSYLAEPGFFKVQRSTTGKLDLVYNKDYVPSKEAESSPSADRNSSNDNADPAPSTDFPAKGNLKTEPTTVAAPNDGYRKSSPIYFPTEEPEREDEEVSYTVNSNDCVEKNGEQYGKPFCTNLRNYPEKTHLEQIIKKKFSHLDIYFGEDLVLPQNISQRMNNEPNEQFLCQSDTRIIYPQAGLNKDYNWMIIVNIPNYKQGIRIEECRSGSNCTAGSGIQLPNGYTASCKQSYIYRSLVAYTNETVIRDQFKMPSCCKCVLRSG